MGYNGVSAATGGDALIQVEMEGLRPDVMLTDLMLPGITPDALVKRLRRTIPDLPVVYMSGSTDPDLSAVAEQRPFYLQKPFSRGQLGTALRDGLAQASAA